MKSPKLIIFLTVFIDLLGFGIIMPLLPRYGERLEASGATLGLLMASFSAMQFLFAPLWGRLSDHIGRRPVLMIGLAGSAVFYALFGYASLQEDLVLLFVARIGAGIAGANISVAQAYIADITPPEKRAGGMAMIGAAFGIGFTFGPLLGAGFVSDVPGGPLSPAAGYLAAGLSFLAFLSSAFLLPESLKPDSKPSERTWLDVSAIRAAASMPGVGLLVLTFFLATFAFGNFEGVLARITANEFGWSDRQNFFGFAAVGIILAFAQGFLVRKLAPKLGEAKMTVIGAALMTAGLGALGGGVAAHSLPLIMAVMPFLITGFAFLTPSVQSLISRRTNPDKQGAILGLNQSASAMARILGPFLGNVLYEAHIERIVPMHTAPLYFGALVMGVAFLLSLRIGTAPEPGTAAYPAGPAGEAQKA